MVLSQLMWKIDMDYSGGKRREKEEQNTGQIHLVAQHGVLFVSLQVQGKHESDHNKRIRPKHR